MKTYIGIDLGGTNLRVGLFDEKINLLDVIKFSTEVEKGSDQIIDKIVQGVNKLKREDTKGLCFCVPGQVDIDKNEIVMLTNLDMNNVKIGDIIQERCQLKTVLNNDANLAGLAESTLGAAKREALVYYITWSTGIGGALIIDNKLINGKNMCSGEIGNLIIHSNHEYKHSFMNKGGLEGLASGSALKRYAVENNFLGVAELIEAYKKNNEKAVEIIEFVTDCFARAIAMIAQVVEVDVFVIGGGVTIKSGEVLLPLVSKKVDKYLMPMMKGSIILKVAELGDEAGIYGAAYLASQTF